MKKVIVFAGISLLTSTMLAQNRETYVRVGVGYAVCIGSAEMKVESKEQAGNTLLTEFRAVPASYGTGWTLSVATTKMLTTNFGLDVKVDIQSGTRTEYWTTPSIVDFLKPMDNNLYYSEGIATAHSNSIMLSPAAFIKFNTRQSVQPYVRAGLAGGVAKIDSWTNEVNRPDYFQSTGSVTCSTTEHSYGYVVGLTIGVGLEYRCLRNVDLFAELDVYRSGYFPWGRNLSELEMSGFEGRRYDRPMVAQYLGDRGAATSGLQIGMKFRVGH